MSCPTAFYKLFVSFIYTVTHGLLPLTPKTVEATKVTEEGKEMMADMIADLINHEKHQISPPPLIDDITTDSSFSESTQKSDSARSGPKLPSDEMAMTLPHSPGNKDGPFSSSQELVRTSSDIKRDYTKKISALGSVLPTSTQDPSSGFTKSTALHLPADSQFRRDVLFAIMERGMRGSNIIARGAATAARRAVQTIDKNRALALMNEVNGDSDGAKNRHARKMTAEEIIIESNPSNPTTGGIVINATIDENEAMEALRLLIIQNRIAQENLSHENAAKSTPSGPNIDDEHIPDDLDASKKGVDAGEVDSRLAGCGRISSSILSALRLWKGGIVSNVELLELVQKDLQFLKQSAVFGSTDETKLIEDSKFWGRFSFGERWAEKKARLAASSPHGSLPGWNLIGCIVKSNDDLRQEAFVMQLIVLCAEAFKTAGLDNLWVHPYEIVATGRSTGIIECVRNAMSFDSLKKRPGYSTDGLVGHFQRMTEIAADPFKALGEAKQNFVSSLAAYSLMSYLFMFKDRHNGNLLLDTAGHVIHIDFGFVFGIAPGGSFSLEQSTPFKLTDEMLEVMGGLGSPLFSEFVTLFCCGFLALQAHADTFLTVVEITCKGSNFHCFDGKDPDEIVSKLRERFCPELNKSQTVAYALDLIKFATTSYGTKQYDYFQYLSQGIAT
jgi:phosphatidylinositol 4-kinase